MPKKVVKKHKVFVLGFGYVEDHMFSNLVVRHRTGFAAVGEALNSLGEAFMEANQEEENACCAKATGRFCQDCGRSRKQHGVGFADVENWILEFAKSVIDGNADTWQCLYDRGWETGIGKGNPFTKGFVHVTDCAESLIAATLFPMDEDHYGGFRTDMKNKIKIYS